jgi:hypothetical protein
MPGEARRDGVAGEREVRRALTPAAAWPANEGERRGGDAVVARGVENA